MIAMAGQVILFLIILLLGFYLMEINLHEGEKSKHKKAIAEIKPYIRRTIILIGPRIIVLLILGLIF